MSHSVMVFVDPGRVYETSSEKIEDKRWQGFVNNIPSNVTKAEQEMRLSKNCWLIPLQSDLPVFCSLIEHARKFQVPTKVLFFDSEPQFISC